MSRLPMDSFLCPYCFEEISHDRVHFRSGRVDTDPPGILPDGYDIYDMNDVERFIKKYNGPDKEDKINQLYVWLRFSAKDDEKYEHFWNKHGGVKTEADPLKKFTHVDSYRLPIIDPTSPEDRKLLEEQPDGSVFVRDSDGMVVQVRLNDQDRTRCTDRVCPHCHNPLPNDYGKFPIKFVSIIGTTSSGKTVYLSQLLKDMAYYATHVGLTASVRSPASRKFYSEDNVVAMGEPLPPSTPYNIFQQPLFYDLSRMENDGIRTDTFVLYDVAGEVFQDSKTAERFVPFIEHSDGLIMLIDPKQLSQAGEVGEGEKSLEEPTAVLEAVSSMVRSGKADEKCKKPFAICISKTDSALVKKMFRTEDDELLEDLGNDVAEVINSDGWAKLVFNANGYAPIAERLNHFMRRTEPAFSRRLMTLFATYAFFGFTALGCDLDEDNAPASKIRPKRIEEPVLWLFYELGFIGIEGSYPLPNPQPVMCPNPGCMSSDTVELTGPDTVYIERWGPFNMFTKEYQVNRKCNACGYKWFHEEEEGQQ